MVGSPVWNSPAGFLSITTLGKGVETTVSPSRAFSKKDSYRATCCWPIRTGYEEATIVCERSAKK